MQEINGYKIPQFPISGLRKISDLIYFDGPLLSHFVSENGDNFLFYWVDVDDLYNRWVIFRTTISDINDYINKKFSLLTLLNKSLNVYVVDIDDSLTYRNIWLTLVSYLPIDYKPEDDSYYDAEISSEELNLNYYSDKYQRGILQVHFGESEKVEYGSIDLSFYSKAMVHFSEMNNSLSNSFYKIERNKQIERKKIKTRYDSKEFSEKLISKQEFLSKIQFQLITTQAASFSVILKASDNELSFDNDIQTRADKYIEYVTSFIESSEDLEALRSFVVPGIDLGAINHYESFLRLLNENHCDFNISYLNRKNKSQYVKVISMDQTFKIINNLQMFDYDETDMIVLEGCFISLNIKNGKYSFESENDKSSGMLDGDAFMKAHNIAFNKVYQVSIERRIIKKAAGKKAIQEDRILFFEEKGKINRLKDEVPF